MALSTLSTARTNGNAGLPWSTGGRKIGFVTVSVTTQSYVTGGLDMSDLFIEELGITFPDEVYAVSIRADNTLPAATEVRARWNRDTQVLVLYAVMIGATVAELSTVALADWEFDLKVTKRKR